MSLLYIILVGLFPVFVAASDPPASPLIYSPISKKVSGDRLLIDPAAEVAMSGLLQVGKLPISIGATSDELKSLSTHDKLKLLSDKKLGRSASRSSVALGSDNSPPGESNSVSSSTSSKKKLHRPITITDNFKRDMLKSGAFGNIVLKRS